MRLDGSMFRNIIPTNALSLHNHDDFMSAQINY